MNTISQNSMVQMAMDGQSLYSVSKSSVYKTNGTSKYSAPVTPNAAQVAKNLEQNIAEIKADTQQLQKMSDIVEGRKLQFNVNKELNTVVIKVVDSDTNQVLKEIPSEDMQRLKLRIRKAIGNIFNG